MQRENIEDREILNKIDDSISQMDKLRLSELNNLKRIQEIKNEIYTKESERFKLKYGPNYPRIIKFKQRMEYNQEMFVGLEKEIEKAKIKKEILPKNAWRVHGRVYDKNNVPLKGQKVVLSIDDQNTRENLPNSITDDLGYFSITVEGDYNHGTHGAIQINFYIKVIKVINREMETVYKSEKPFPLKKGVIDFHDIYLEENG